MKINGEKVSGSDIIEVVVFPRQTGNIVFKARVVLNFDTFEMLCPEPEPPVNVFPTGEVKKQVLDPTYIEARDTWAERRTNWLILESIKATPNLEWETVVADDPKTWGNFQTELTESGFSGVEITRLIGCVISVCGLDQEKIDKATKDFLATAAETRKE